jgi:uncharacterized protein (UPF0332 family)
MAGPVRNKLISRLTQPVYALIRGLTDGASLDAESLEHSIGQVVAARLALAEGMLAAARLLAGVEDILIRRSAVSRAYYGAYQAARAAVFVVTRRDVDDHEKLPAVIDEVAAQAAVGQDLKELRRLRNEMDYSPYPGPNPENEYTADELAAAIAEGVARSEAAIHRLQEFLAQRA